MCAGVLLKFDGRIIARIFRVFNLSAIFQKMLHCQRKTCYAQNIVCATAMQSFLENALTSGVKNCTCSPPLRQMYNSGTCIVGFSFHHRQHHLLMHHVFTFKEIREMVTVYVENYKSKVKISA